MTADTMIHNEKHEVLAQAEAVLQSNLDEALAAGELAPAWLWLDTLAHTDWATLEHLAAQPGRHLGYIWDGALMYLATELLAVTGSPEELMALQRCRLIPLELDLWAAGPDAFPSPADLVNQVRARLSHWHPRVTTP